MAGRSAIWSTVRAGVRSSGTAAVSTSRGVRLPAATATHSVSKSGCFSVLTAGSISLSEKSRPAARNALAIAARPSSLRRALAGVDEAADARARLAGDDEAFPGRRRRAAAGGDDLDLVAVLQRVRSGTIGR